MSLILGILDSGGAAASTSSYESIATLTPSSGATSVNFTSIPSTYSHLQIRATYKDTTTSDQTTDITFYFNGGTGSFQKFAYHNLLGNGASATASAASTQTYSDFEFGSSSATGMSNIVGVGIIDIIDYASTTKNKTVRMFGGMNANATTSTHKLTLGSAFWNQTTAISEINIFAGYSAFATGTTFALYGIKG